MPTFIVVGIVLTVMTCRFTVYISMCLLWIVQMYETRETAAFVEVCAILLSVISSPVYETSVHQQPENIRPVEAIRVAWEEERGNDSHFTPDKCD